MKKLYKFYWNCGRQGNIESLFIAEEKQVQEIIGQNVYFGEILGKHSEIYGIIKQDDIKEIKVSPITIKEMEDIIGSTISGRNPLNYVHYTCCECGNSYHVDDMTFYINKNGDKICGDCAENMDKQQLIELD